MQAFKICHLRRIAGLHQGFKTGLYQGRSATAQYRLLTEQICFSFFLKSRFNDTGTTTAIGRGIRQGDIPGTTAGILKDCNQARNTGAVSIGRAHQVARPFRCNHNDIKISTRLDLFVMNIEAMRKRQCCTLLDIWRNTVTVEFGLVLIRGQHHHHVSAGNRIINRLDSQP